MLLDHGEDRYVLQKPTTINIQKKKCTFISIYKNKQAVLLHLFGVLHEYISQFVVLLLFCMLKDDNVGCFMTTFSLLIFSLLQNIEHTLHVEVFTSQQPLKSLLRYRHMFMVVSLNSSELYFFFSFFLLIEKIQELWKQIYISLSNFCTLCLLFEVF